MKLYKNKEQLLNCSFNFAAIVDQSKNSTHTICLWRVNNAKFDLTNHHTAWAIAANQNSCLCRCLLVAVILLSRADLFWTKNDLCTNGSVSDEDLVVYIKRCRSMMPIQVITNMRWNIYTLVYSNRRTAALKYPRNLFWSKIDSISRLKLDPRYPKFCN